MPKLHVGVTPTGHQVHAANVVGRLVGVSYCKQRIMILGSETSHEVVSCEPCLRALGLPTSMPLRRQRRAMSMVKRLLDHEQHEIAGNE